MKVDVPKLVEDVEFSPQFNPEALAYDPKQDFLKVEGFPPQPNRVHVFGFAVPLARYGGFDVASELVDPITRFSDLPRENRNVDQQGKGVGPRLHNTLSAVGSMGQHPERIGAYVVSLNPNYIFDGRSAQGNAVQRIARHAGRLLGGKLFGAERVVEGIHRSYESAHGDLVDAVELEVPPRGNFRRQILHGLDHPEGMTPSFLIIRNAAVVMRKVGEAPTPW